MLKMSSNLCQADLHTPGNDITMSCGVFLFPGPLFIVSPLCTQTEEPGFLFCR